MVVEESCSTHDKQEVERKRSDGNKNTLPGYTPSDYLQAGLLWFRFWMSLKSFMFSDMEFIEGNWIMWMLYSSMN